MDSDLPPLQSVDGFNRTVLITVAGQDGPDGLDVKAAVDPHYETDIPHGRVYDALDELVTDGWLEKRPVGRQHNEYHLTDTAKRNLESYRDWIAAQLMTDTTTHERTRSESPHRETGGDAR